MILSFLDLHVCRLEIFVMLGSYKVYHIVEQSPWLTPLYGTTLIYATTKS